MIAVDTNVLLRHLYQHDDARQSQLANGIVADATAAGSSIFVSSIVLVETVWVLRQGYRIDRAGLLRVLDALSDESNVVLEHAPHVRASIDAFRRGRADFADHLLGRIAREAGARTTYTFDRGLRGVEGFTWVGSR